MALGDTLLAPAPDPWAERRFRTLSISSDVVLSLVAQAGRAGDYTVEGLPPDAKVQRTSYEIRWDCVVLLITSMTFDPVPEHHTAPELVLRTVRLEPDHVVIAP
jgi:hypothetical protein